MATVPVLKKVKEDNDYGVKLLNYPELSVISVLVYVW